MIRTQVYLSDSQSEGIKSLAIYPPKCVMISLSDEDYPTTVIMDSSAIALTLKITFDTLWELL